MKKFAKFSIYLYVCLCAVVSAFAYTPHRIEAVDTRSEAFGGPYFTDSSSVYALFTNPSALAFAENKTLWPPLAAVGMGGPLDKMFKLGMDILTKKVDTNDPAALSVPLLDMIGDSGFNLNMRIGGPLTFGAIRNNFGWGFVNTLYAHGNVYSLMKSDIRAGGDLGFVAGYGFPLDLGVAGVLSVGVSGRSMVQLQANYVKGVAELFAGTGNPLSSVPVYLSFGFGFDMGVQYKIFDMLSIALVWQDAYAPLWIKKFETVEQFAAFRGSPFKYAQAESKLGAGVELDFPVAEATKNIVSKLTVYADYNNLWPILQKKTFYRNPILELSFGAEAVLFKVLAVRAGVNDMYPAAGLGLNLGKFKIDASVFGKELGFEPGYNPQLNAGFSMSIKY
ncbi:hypothetical protein H0R92_09705 [Treponema sp. OMZ 840]|uniref:hypothetical protein n=1 Tax=Treponema sp. OMZ 840 TaxID=244313 RepID=UPI003D8FB528